MLFHVSGWSLRKRKSAYILTFENSRNITPDVLLSEYQLIKLIREGIQIVGSDKVHDITEFAVITETVTDSKIGEYHDDI